MNWALCFLGIIFKGTKVLSPTLITVTSLSFGIVKTGFLISTCPGAGLTATNVFLSILIGLTFFKGT